MLSNLWSAVTAPGRFFNYINRPGVERQERFNALSAKDKEAWKRREQRKLPDFLAFAWKPYDDPNKRRPK